MESDNVDVSSEKGTERQGISMKIHRLSVDTATLAYAIFGSGKIDMVIEMGLGAVMGEWWNLARRLSAHHTILLYERAGYGSSSMSTLERTPENIARELYILMQQLGCDDQVTFLAHSQGGLYAQQFARLYPSFVRKLVLLDPLSPEDNRFRSELTASEFKKSGADKTAGLRINLWLSRLHMGWLVRKMMSAAPPFYYCNGFSEEQKEYILAAISKPQIYETALEEYQKAHDPEMLKGLKGAEGFPQIPVVLITHDSKIEEKEIMDFGGASKEEAEIIEKMWQEIMCEYLTFSSQSTHLRATNSSHYIHLTDGELVYELLKKK